MTWRPLARTNGSPHRLQSGTAMVSLPIQETSPPELARSLASALFSICLTRSLVIPMRAPISSSVMPHGCSRTARCASRWVSHSRSAQGSGICAGARPRRFAGGASGISSGGTTRFIRRRMTGCSGGARRGTARLIRRRTVGGGGGGTARLTRKRGVGSEWNATATCDCRTLYRIAESSALPMAVGGRPHKYPLVHFYICRTIPSPGMKERKT